MCELLDKYENRGLQRGLQEGIQKGIQKGMQKGMQKGIRRGELRLAFRIEKLLQSNRMENIQKVVSKENYRNRLYEELGIL